MVIISPHGPIMPGSIGIWAVGTLKGDFARFGAPEVAFTVENDLGCSACCWMKGEQQVIPARGRRDLAQAVWISPDLDYATLIPLYYLEKAGVRKPVLPMGMGFFHPRKLYEFGVILRRAVEKAGRRAVIIASGDLSHRLTVDAPAGYSKSGPAFDRTLWDLLSKGDVEGILNIDPQLREDAGECGYRSLVMMLGCWEGRSVKTVPLSYEGPFGVGYGVCLIRDKDLYLASLGEDEGRQSSRPHPLVELARRTVEAIARGEAPPSAEDVSPFLGICPPGRRYL